jgi:predicted Zn-dependent peptidase
LESMSSRMMRMSRNELIHQRDIPVEETLAKIDAVSNHDIITLANQILDEKLVSTTAIGPNS